MPAIGQPFATLVRRSDLFDARDGPIYEEVWEGTESAVRSVEYSLRGSPYFISTRIENQGAKYVLIARFNAQTGSIEITEPTLEIFLDGPRHAKDILQSPAAASLSDNDRRAIREAIQNPVDGEAPDLTGTAQQIYALMLKGLTDYTIYQPTLRIRRLANSYNYLAAVYANVGRIISTASLPAEAGILGEVYPALPDEASNDAELAYGWLKHYPSFGPSSREFRQLSYEYEYGLWSVLIYGAAL